MAKSELGGSIYTRFDAGGSFNATAWCADPWAGVVAATDIAPSIMDETDDCGCLTSDDVQALASVINEPVFDEELYIAQTQIDTVLCGQVGFESKVRTQDTGMANNRLTLFRIIILILKNLGEEWLTGGERNLWERLLLLTLWTRTTWC